MKSLRAGRATLSEAWAGERDGEMWLFNCYIPEWQAGSFVSQFEPRRPRKLLVHRKQVATLTGAMTREGATIVPLDIHFNERGLAKILLGVAEGKKQHDKRAAIAERDWQRDKSRMMRNKGREQRPRGIAGLASTRAPPHVMAARRPDGRGRHPPDRRGSRTS